MITLGIDTSNYTTSVATFDGETYEMSKSLLDVREGMRGIRQSEGVFLHNKALPDMIIEQLKHAERKIDAVGVSIRPRSIEGSYMPVFTVGEGYAKVVAASLGVPLYMYSHQDGHIMAGIYSANAPELIEKPFISLHLSGGTTEILLSRYTESGFSCEIVGGTLDISVGQLIDRIGVAMGMKFPCGRELEELAEEGNKQADLPFAINGSYINLSGIETKLTRNINGYDPDIAKTVLCYIRDALIKAVNHAISQTGAKRVLAVGGVASNRIIRKGFSDKLNATVYLTSPELSTDNAVGTAILAYMQSQTK